MNINLVNDYVVLENEMPELFYGNELELKIKNFKSLKGNLVLRIDYDNTHKIYKVDSDTIILPVELLKKELKSFDFTLKNGSNIVLFKGDASKFRVKNLIGVSDSDKLVDLLTVLYNKYIVLEKEYEKLDNALNDGDLMI